MSSMSPWHPDDIGRLTMVQLLCIGSDKPINVTSITSAEEFEASEPKWGRAGLLVLSAAIGLLLGLGGLTSYAFSRVICSEMGLRKVHPWPRTFTHRAQ